MRTKLLLLTGAACFLATSAQAGEQGAPVVFATDPGAAHPRYIGEALATGSGTKTKLQAQEKTMPVEMLMASDPGVSTVDRSQVIQSGTAYATSDRGGFDYGYASNEVELAVAGNPPASSGPTRLLNDHGEIITASSVQGSPNYAQAPVQNEPVATPYRQDPIYKITETAEEASAKARTDLAYREVAATGYVRVQPGDTVYALSRRYGIRANSIIAANGMIAPYALQVGQILKIPGLEKPETYKAQYTQSDRQRNVTVTNSVPIARGQTYIVRQGNTLYSIARAFGHDVTTVAAANRLTPPYTLSIGQQLAIPADGQSNGPGIAPAPIAPSIISGRALSNSANRNTYIEPQNQPTYQRDAKLPAVDPAKNVSFAMPDKLGESRFSWPIQGKVVMGYGLGADGRRNDGINIAAPVGTPIRAVEDGEIVYRGSDLEGYGNLLLVKHSGGWVSAYAHTDAMLVRKGEKVRRGQVIAKVGTTGTVGQPQLHFELRHDLKPTDPLAALEGRNALAIQ